MNNVKMSDIAKAAGVSMTTVGRAIHGGYISDDKREKINKAIDELGYVPDKMARSLKNHESRMIGHLMIFNPNMLYANINNSISRCALEKGYSVFSLTNYNWNFGEQIDEFISRRVDAVVLTSISDFEERYIKKLTAMDIPVVMVERTQKFPKVDRVIVNDVGGAYKAVFEMINSGRKRIGFIGVNRPKESVEIERKNGYLQSLHDSGLPVENRLIFEAGEYDINNGYLGAKAIIEAGAEPDALFCTSDILAAGAMQYLYEREIRVPQAVMVTGYDDTISNMVAPKINSVALDTEKIGELVMNMILARLENPQIPDQIERVDTIYIGRN